MNYDRFATAINCMDGRTQLPVINYVLSKYRVDFLDMITAPGPVKILAENRDTSAVEHIRRCVGISTEKHGSNHIAIVAHHDCAGNSEEKEVQIRQIMESIRTVQSWIPKVEIIGLWIDEKWTVHEVT
jgi:hypothetical protein